MSIKIFPVVRRFEDIKLAESSVILKQDISLHQKGFRSGSIFFILGWREINESAYIVMSKGSWQGLIEFNYIKDKVEPLK